MFLVLCHRQWSAPSILDGVHHTPIFPTDWFFEFTSLNFHVGSLLLAALLNKDDLNQDFLF